MIQELSLNEEYYKWLLNAIDFRNHYEVRNYSKLLDHLYATDFYYTLERDGDRSQDGIYLRYRFAYRTNKEIGDYKTILQVIGPEYCSVLEMMVALAIRCEEQIMQDDDYGDRTPLWFWAMIKNMGLNKMSNDCYSEEVVSSKIEKMLNRKYRKNGSGGLFSTIDPNKDMRSIDIWYQMNTYLIENYD